MSNLNDELTRIASQNASLIPPRSQHLSSTGSTASILSAMRTSQPAISSDAKNNCAMNIATNFNNNGIVNGSKKNIESLRAAESAYPVGISSYANSINLTQCHSDTPRQTIYFTDGMNRSIAQLNASDMYSVFRERPLPQPSISRGPDGFFSSGGEGGKSNWVVCNSSGVCYNISGGNDCRGSNDSRCSIKR